MTALKPPGSGISPFIPHSSPSSTPAKLLHLTLFVFRLPFLISYVAFYFLLAQHIPLLPQALNKLLVWGLLAIPQIWWGDLQLDGVKRGSLSQQPPGRMPSAPPASLIAASFTSPVDAVYLAAVFDPIFTISYPRSRKVSKVGLWGAIWHALSPAQLRTDPPANGTTTVEALLAENPGRVVAVFPECATTNGQGILPFSPSLLTAPAGAKIFPVSIRYASPAITTPVPGAWTSFLWRLLSRPTHVMRIRIAEAVYNTSGAVNGVGETSGADLPARSGGSRAVDGAGGEPKITPEERRVLDRVAENLARLGRNKRVGLTIEDKAKFVEAWNRK